MLTYFLLKAELSNYEKKNFAQPIGFHKFFKNDKYQIFLIKKLLKNCHFQKLSAHPGSENVVLALNFLFQIFLRDV